MAAIKVSGRMYSLSKNRVRYTGGCILRYCVPTNVLGKRPLSQCLRKGFGLKKEKKRAEVQGGMDLGSLNWEDEQIDYGE